ncbi:unnamed protein product [Closterium sp. NIES-65]|nr:unnamed protein product [Closterium sp. NIES-65]
MDWQLAKENIEPRTTDAALKEALVAVNSGNIEEEYESQKRSLLEEIRNYDGDDPLDPWDRYIKLEISWSVTSGDNSELFDILKSCAETFLSCEQYKNDIRYLRIWIRYAGLTGDPLKVFSLLTEEGIGWSHNLFYEGLATVLEHLHDFKQANAVYGKGLKRCIEEEPQKLLQKAYRKFRDRMAARSLRKQQRKEQEHTRLVSGREGANQNQASRIGLLAPANPSADEPAAAVGGEPERPVALPQETRLAARAPLKEGRAVDGRALESGAAGGGALTGDSSNDGGDVRRGLQQMGAGPTTGKHDENTPPQSEWDRSQAFKRARRDSDSGSISIGIFEDEELRSPSATNRMRRGLGGGAARRRVLQPRVEVERDQVGHTEVARERVRGEVGARRGSSEAESASNTGPCQEQETSFEEQRYLYWLRHRNLPPPLYMHATPLSTSRSTLETHPNPTANPGPSMADGSPDFSSAAADRAESGSGRQGREGTGEARMAEDVGEERAEEDAGTGGCEQRSAAGEGEARGGEAEGGERGAGKRGRRKRGSKGEEEVEGSGLTGGLSELGMEEERVQGFRQMLQQQRGQDGAAGAGGGGAGAGGADAGGGRIEGDFLSFDHTVHAQNDPTVVCRRFPQHSRVPTFPAGPPQQVNPWSTSMRASLLAALQPPLTSEPGYQRHSDPLHVPARLKALREGKAGEPVDLRLGSRSYEVDRLLGKGAYAKVYGATETPAGVADAATESTVVFRTVALKLHSKACPWEFYIYRQIQLRIDGPQRQLFGAASAYHEFPNASILTCSLGTSGTLQKPGKPVPEELCTCLLHAILTTHPPPSPLSPLDLTTHPHSLTSLPPQDVVNAFKRQGKPVPEPLSKASRCRSRCAPALNLHLVTSPPNPTHSPPIPTNRLPFQDVVNAFKKQGKPVPEPLSKASRCRSRCAPALNLHLVTSPPNPTHSPPIPTNRLPFQDVVNAFKKQGKPDVVNAFKKQGKPVPEPLCAFYTAQMLRAAEALHAAHILHGDIKPDNFLLRFGADSESPREMVAAIEAVDNLTSPIRLSNSPVLTPPHSSLLHSPLSFPLLTSSHSSLLPTTHSSPLLQGLTLVDYGRSIDMRHFPEGSSFVSDSGTENFRCPEMEEGRPWTTQADLYAVCATAYCLLHGQYMEVERVPAGEGGASGAADVDGCDDVVAASSEAENPAPPPAPIRRRFERYSADHASDVSVLLRRLRNQL